MIGRAAHRTRLFGIREAFERLHPAQKPKRRKASGRSAPSRCTCEPRLRTCRTTRWERRIKSARAELPCAKCGSQPRATGHRFRSVIAHRRCHQWWANSGGGTIRWRRAWPPVLHKAKGRRRLRPPGLHETIRQRRVRSPGPSVAIRGRRVRSPGRRSTQFVLRVLSRGVSVPSQRESPGH